MDKYILIIETATPVCSVALSKNHTVLDYIDSAEPNMHANQLTLYVEELLSRNNLVASELHAVAVSLGPGSYTGLRIGVSTAKGLCYALDIPVIGIHTLDAMADWFANYHSQSENTVLVPMIDARRMEVYCAFYKNDGKQISETQAKIIDSLSFEEFVSEGKQMLLFGSGADKFSDLFSENPSIEIFPEFKNSARFLATKAYQKFVNQEFEDMAYFEPFYLKEFVTTVSKKSLL
ncbi:tRNA (adenosine(37)-N6)-threonylcarbamoyltransferase complex dimerization subunit type 1 TsaB [Sphingobacterium hungaricum]